MTFLKPNRIPLLVLLFLLGWGERPALSQRPRGARERREHRIPLERLASFSDLIIVGTVVELTDGVKTGNVRLSTDKVLIKTLVKGKPMGPFIGIQKIFTNPNRTLFPEPIFLDRYASYLLFLRKKGAQNYAMTVPYDGAFEIRNRRFETTGEPVVDVVKRLQADLPKGAVAYPEVHKKYGSYAGYYKKCVESIVQWSMDPNKQRPGRPPLDVWRYFHVKEALPALHTLAEGESPHLSKEALKVLKWIGDDSSVEVLGRIAGKQESRIAIETLARIGNPAAGPALLKVVTKTEDDYIGRLAAIALGRVKYEKAVPDLIPRLGKGTAKKQERILVALGEIGGEAAKRALARYFAHVRNAELKAWTARALGKIGVNEALPGIVAMMTGKNGNAVAAMRNDFFPFRSLTKKKWPVDWLDEKEPCGFHGEVLTSLVKHAKQDVRLFALRVLKAQGPGSAEALKAALQSSDRETVREAVNILGEWDYKPAAKKLASMVDLPVVNEKPPVPFPPPGPSLTGPFDPHERQVACLYRILHVLGRIGGPDQIPLLQEKLKDDRPHIRVAAIRALTALRAEGLGPKFLALAQKEKNAAIRGVLLRALGEIGERAAVPLLMASLPDQTCGITALFALEKIVPGDYEFYVKGYGLLGSILEARKAWWEKEKWTWAAEPGTSEANRKRIDPLIRDLAAESFEKRTAATKALIAIGKPAAEKLEAVLESPDPEVRFRARFILHAIRWKRVTPAGLPGRICGLFERLGSEDPEDQRAVIKEIRKLKHPLCVPLLEVLIKATDEDVRSDAFDALVEIKHPAIRPVMTKLAAEGSDGTYRAGAVSALGSLEDEVDIPVFRKAAEDADPGVREQAVLALGKFKREDLAPILIRALKDEKEVRAAAAYCLGEMRCQAAVPALIEMVGDEKICIYQAVYALGSIGDKRAVEVIRKALKYADPNVREAALSVLKRWE
ncbi:MAG: HEAT repeat domain-containing protein [Planctomycetota bacterium]|jgi:HEAT repeat protein